MFDRIFGGLANVFRPSFFWWPSLQLGYRIVFAIIFAVAGSQEDLTSLHFALLVSLLGMTVIQVVFRPYGKEQDNWAETFQMLILCLIASVFAAYDNSNNNSYALSLTGIIMFATGSLGISVLLLFLIVKRFRNLVCTRQRKKLLPFYDSRAEDDRNPDYVEMESLHRMQPSSGALGHTASPSGGGGFRSQENS